MKMVDSNALHELKAWVFDTDQNILSNHIRYHSHVEITRIRYLATIVADQLHKTHPTYESQLRGIANRLFSPVTHLGYTLNPRLFGQLYLMQVCLTCYGIFQKGNAARCMLLKWRKCWSMNKLPSPQDLSQSVFGARTQNTR